MCNLYTYRKNLVRRATKPCLPIHLFQHRPQCYHPLIAWQVCLLLTVTLRHASRGTGFQPTTSASSSLSCPRHLPHAITLPPVKPCTWYALLSCLLWPGYCPNRWGLTECHGIWYNVCCWGSVVLPWESIAPDLGSPCPLRHAYDSTLSL